MPEEHRISASPASEGPLLRINAGGLADTLTDLSRPVSVWVRLPPGTCVEPLSLPLPGPARVVGVIPSHDLSNPVEGTPPEGLPDATLDLPRSILIPGLVNTHTHLDLTSIGPRSHDPEAGFVSWIDLVRRERPIDTESIRAALETGIEKTISGGVIAVGDILGAVQGQPTTTGLEPLKASGLLGIGFVEFFGIGTRSEAVAESLPSLAAQLAEFNLGCQRTGACKTRGFRAGLQPHAPNTVSLRNYVRAVELSHVHGVPLSTHLAETLEERRFISEAEGPQRELLENLGLWSDVDLNVIGKGMRPVAHLESALGRATFVAVHLNDADDAAIETLARTETSVVYCPRASAYFGAPERLGPHRYRDMLDAGVNVCLGTDSIINLDTPDRITPLDDAKLLYHRDGADPSMLLDMITRRGARALGLNEDMFLFQSGTPMAGVAAVTLPDDRIGNLASAASAAIGGGDQIQLLIGVSKSG